MWRSRASFACLMLGAHASGVGCVALATETRPESEARVPLILPPDAQGPTHAEPASVERPAPARAANLPVAPGELWAGTYACGGVARPVRIRIEAVQGSRVDAVLERADAGWVLSGSYEPSSGALELLPTRWVLEAPGVLKVGLYGTVSSAEGVYEGRVTEPPAAPPTCGGFSLRRGARLSRSVSP